MTTAAVCVFLGCGGSEEKGLFTSGPGTGGTGTGGLGAGGACDPGVQICQGNSVATCLDGSGYQTTTVCEANEVCVSTASRVQCEVRLGTGGVAGSGGAVASGGTVAVGGLTGTGGTAASGGTVAIGGLTGTGGTTAPGGSGGQSAGGTSAACDETACPACTALQNPCCTSSDQCGCLLTFLCVANTSTGGTTGMGGAAGTGGAWTQCQSDGECTGGRICSKSATGTRPGSCTYACTFPSTAGCDPPLPGAGAVQCPLAGICAMLCGPGDTCPTGRECAIVSGNGPYCVYPESP